MTTLIERRPYDPAHLLGARAARLSLVLPIAVAVCAMCAAALCAWVGA
jgi:hypothetical protein